MRQHLVCVVIAWWSAVAMRQNGEQASLSDAGTHEVFGHAATAGYFLEENDHLAEIIPSEVTTGLTLYNTMNNVMGLASFAKEWHSLAKYSLTSDLNHNLDSLRSVHDLLVQKISLVPAQWNATCDNCTDTELDSKYTIGRDWSIASITGQITDWISGAVAAQDDDSIACPLRLKRMVANMRRILVILDAECDNLLQQLLITSKSKRLTPEYIHYGDRACDQQHQSTLRKGEDSEADEATEALQSELQGFYVQADSSTGLCRNLPETMSREQVVEACQEQCHVMEGCKGFTLYNGTLSEFGPRRTELDSWWNPLLDSTARYGQSEMEAGDEIGFFKKGTYRTFRKCKNIPVTLDPTRESCKRLGRLALQCGDQHLGCFALENLHLLRKRTRTQTVSNQCCFTTSVLEADTQEHAECFVRPLDNPLQNMGTSAAAAWLEALPTGNDTNLTEAFAKAANHFRAAKLNGLAMEAMGAIQIQENLGIEDPKHVETLTCMIDATKAGTSASVCIGPGFMQQYNRMRGIVDPFIFFGLKIDLRSPAWIMSALKRVTKSVKSYWKQNAWIFDKPIAIGSLALEAYYIHGSAMTLAAQSAVQDATGGVDWLAVTSSVSYLLKVSTDIAWNQCPMVESWLSKTDVADPEKMDNFVESRLSMGA